MTGVTLQELDDLGFSTSDTDILDRGWYKVFRLQNKVMNYTIEYNDEGEEENDYFTLINWDIPTQNLKKAEYLKLIELTKKAFE